MNSKLTFITFFIILFLSFTQANAQTESAFTPSHLQAAESYLIATGINTKFGTITDNVVNTFSTQIPENTRAAFVNIMENFMHKYYTWDALKGDLSKMYAAEFTEDELNQLTVFFNTQIGKKYGEKIVVLEQKGMLLGQQIIKDHQPELERMMKDGMADKN
jgi:uncharacterized protein